jgi:tetratricopeptide (TPR) repeat protein
VIAYHVEAALEQGSGDEAELTDRLLEHLSTASLRAAFQDDFAVEVSLCRRALARLPAEHPGRPRFVARSVDALAEIGRIHEATELLGAEPSGPEVLPEGRALLRVSTITLEVYAASRSTNVDAMSADLVESIGTLEQVSDHEGLIYALRAQALLFALRGQLHAADQAAEQIAVHRASIGFPQEGRGQMPISLLGGASPLTDEALERVTEIAEGRFTLDMKAQLATLYGLRGDLATADRLIREAADRIGALGNVMRMADVDIERGTLELWRGDTAEAERIFRRAARMAAAHGDLYVQAEALVKLARTLVSVARAQEALEQVDRAATLAHPHDLATQAQLEQARGLARSALGDHDGALGCLRGALELLRGSSYDYLRADVHADLGTALAAAGCPDEAVAEVESAREIFSTRGAIGRAAAMAERRDQISTEPRR